MYMCAPALFLAKYATQKKCWNNAYIGVAV